MAGGGTGGGISGQGSAAWEAGLAQEGVGPVAGGTLDPNPIPTPAALRGLLGRVPVGPGPGTDSGQSLAPT